jgi:hypothetical protein
LKWSGQTGHCHGAVRTLIVDDHAAVRFLIRAVAVVSKDRVDELPAAVLRAAGRL